MYLTLLNKKEQENFLELARYSMGLNGEYKDEEEDMLKNYKFECHLSDYIAFRQDEIENIIKTLSKSTKQVKKIVLVELFGILLSDGEVCSEEGKFMDELANRFQIEEYEVKRVYRWVEAMSDIVEEGYELISK